MQLPIAIINSEGCTTAVAAVPKGRGSFGSCYNWGDRFAWEGTVGYEETMLRITTIPHNKHLKLKTFFFFCVVNIFMWGLLLKES